MCSLSNLLEIAGVLAAGSALVACTGDMDGGAGGPAPGPAPPSLGVAKERLTTSDWRISGDGDFNFDGMGDVLWNNSVKNTMAVWAMSGTHLLSPGPVIPGPIGPGWRTLRSADFNADRMIDVPWSNSDASTMAVWLMSGTHLLSPGPVIPGPIGAGWNAVVAADFNSDGSADMLWYNAEKSAMAVWLMDGDHLLLPGPVQPTPLGAGWAVTTASDFNLDGMADILWYNSSMKSMAVWLMSGTHLLLPGPVIPGPLGAGWVPASTADFNVDGMSDVIWRNPGNGSMAVWLMDGTQLLLPGPEIPGPLGAGWIVAVGGDVNFDGMADGFWYNNQTNRMAVWLMSGTQLLLPGPEVPGPPDLGP
ncbi:MAG: VCBS repeat-containing protein [Byssovorax sp.]